MPRRVAYAWAVGLALAMHGAAVWWVWPRPSPHVQKQVTYISATITTVPPTIVTPVLETTRATGEPLASPAEPRQQHAVNGPQNDLAAAEKPVETPAQPPQPTASSATEPVAVEATPPIATPTVLDGYLPLEEVDQPAHPIGDWLINPMVLPRGLVVRIELLLWISASGKIDRWALGPDTPNEEVVARDLAELDQTPTQPALRNNIAVPNFRRLEVFISRE
jgi:hypothetical protein